MKTMLRFLGVLLVAAMLAVPVQAHELWINMTDYSPNLWQHPKYAPTPRAKTVAYFGWGHKYPAADLLDKKYLETMVQVEPDGTRKEITVGEGGFRAVEIKMHTKGARIFAAKVNPGFYQEVKGKKDFYKMRYEMYAKALVNVGELEDNPFSKPVGHGVEIIPAKNPNALKPGDTLSVTVLSGGKPAKDFNIKAIPMYSGTGEVEKLKTDANGKAVVTIKPFYGPWLITASKMEPATEEFKDKCEEFFKLATMTFGVKKSSEKHGKK